jgi:hypothetical protein
VKAGKQETKHIKGAGYLKRAEGRIRGFYLEPISKGDQRLWDYAKIHYTKTKGFVGRFLGYCVNSLETDETFGVIVGGSAALHLQGREKFFGLKGKSKLNAIVGNTLFHIEKPKSAVKEEGAVYPLRNTTARVLQVWRERVAADWERKYGDEVIGFETMVMPPRTGACYKKDGWTYVGMTKGFVCRRIPCEDSAGEYSGKRVWTHKPDEKKLIFCRKKDLDHEERS